MPIFETYQGRAVEEGRGQKGEGEVDGMENNCRWSWMIA